MLVRFISQPDRELVGDEIVAHLEAPETIRFWAASAWVRVSALERLQPQLGTFSARVPPNECRGLFGVDLGGTTREALELAAQRFGRARVFHASGNPRRTFHPKLFLVERALSAHVYVGSANMTAGGFWGNFETGVLVELDLESPEDVAFLADIRRWFARWWSDPNGSRPVNAGTIAALEADPEIRLPREGDVRRLIASRRGRAGAPARAFPNRVVGLRRFPAPPAGVDRAGEQDGGNVDAVEAIAVGDMRPPRRRADRRVLVAGIPRDRWRQVGFNRTVVEEYFRVFTNGDALSVQGVSQSGALRQARASQLVLAASNQNHRIEFPEPDGRADPRPHRGILVVLETAFRTFRYMSIRPGDVGYAELQQQLLARPALGDARSNDTKRVLMRYGELQDAWPGACPLRP